MRTSFEEIITLEKKLNFLYEDVLSFEAKCSSEFIETVMRPKTIEKGVLIEKLNSLINDKVNQLIDSGALSKRAIKDLLKLAESLFKYEIDGRTIYLDKYVSRDIYVRMLSYFEGVGDVDNQLLCIYWLIKISHSLRDMGNGILFFEKAMKYRDGLASLSPKSKKLMFRILVNKSTVMSDNSEVIVYLKDLERFINENRKVFGISKDTYNFAMFVIYNNLVDCGNEMIRSNKVNDPVFIEGIYEYSKIAKDYEIIFDGEGTISTLTPLLIEIKYYHGDFESREDYYKEIDKILKVLGDSSMSESFSETKEEIEVSLRELYLIDGISNPNISTKAKVDLMREIFGVIFKTLEKSKMTHDEISFSYNYLTRYINIACDVIEVEDVIRDVAMIMKDLQRFTFVHSVEVSEIAVAITEEYLPCYPEEFVGCLGTTSAQEVFLNKKKIVDFTRSSLLSHDFGKIGIATVVSKSNKLTEYEFDMIKSHTTTGYDFLMSSTRLGDHALMAISHHLSPDGKFGYPRVSFELWTEILSLGVMRPIATISDVTSAATDAYGRTYNRAKSFEGVLGEMIANPRMFDSKIVNFIANNPKLIAKIESIIGHGREELLFRTFTNKEIRV